MYGTVARLQLKPGTSAQDFARLSEPNSGIEGMIGSYVYQTDSDPNALYLAVIFESREAYRKNAESPEQNERFMQMMQGLAAEPEWHDGEIIWSFPS